MYKVGAMISNPSSSSRGEGGDTGNFGELALESTTMTCLTCPLIDFFLPKNKNERLRGTPLIFLRVEFFLDDTERLFKEIKLFNYLLSVASRGVTTDAELSATRGVDGSLLGDEDSVKLE